jgi:hypothetical protein
MLEKVWPIWKSVILSVETTPPRAERGRVATNASVGDDGAGAGELGASDAVSVV